MNVLVIGGGGREHAIVKALKKSSQIDELFCAPANAGIAKDAHILNLNACDKQGIASSCKKHNIKFVVVSPDNPLAEGMVDHLNQEGIECFGPKKNAAIIEYSKSFSKNLMKKYQIPTASFEVFGDIKDAYSFLDNKKTFPIVVKADGLALGKGVTIAYDLASAKRAVKEILVDKKFSKQNKVVIEEFLEGPEISVLTLTDSKTIKPLISCMDHKKALDGNKGLNTGGMGCIAPNPFYTKEVASFCMEKIFKPTVSAMNNEGRPFCGCLYFGLMLTKEGPKVIEYNSRFGDPEAQVVLPLLSTDLFKLMRAISKKELSKIDIEFEQKAAACVIMASKGYPLNYQKGFKVEGLAENGSLNSNAIVYHSSTILKDNQFLTNGGRVLGITAVADNLQQAITDAYFNIQKINFDNAYYRTDIGKF